MQVGRSIGGWLRWCALATVLAALSACSAPPTGAGPGSECPRDRTCGDSCCAEGVLCWEGSCGCPSGMLDCFGECIDPLTSEAHCGAALDCLAPHVGVRCASPRACQEGSCVCPDDRVYCDGQCVDPLNDPVYCGARESCGGVEAGERCDADRDCVAGACLCRAPLVECDGRCLDPLTDRDHCGASGDCGAGEAGVACESDSTCMLGACACNEPLVRCAGACIDPGTDPMFCGAEGDCAGERSGQVCREDQTCQGACLDVDPALAALSFSAGNLVPAFSPETTSYTLVVRFDVTSVRVQATPASDGASMMLNNLPLEPGTNSEPYRIGTATSFRIDVAAPAGATRAYRVDARFDLSYLKASNTSTAPEVEVSPPEFGYSVAVSGDTLAVGAFSESNSARGVSAGSEENDGGAFRSGAVFVYRRTNGTWEQDAYIKLPVGASGQGFGFNVALSDDTLAVSANTGSCTPAQGGGVVLVYRRIAGVWTDEACLQATDSSDGFSRVALDGDLLAIGAQGEASSATGVNGDELDNSTPYSGAVYLYRRVEGVWTREAYVKASNRGGAFGLSLGVSGDTLVVGAPGEDGTGRGMNADPLDPGSIDAASSGAVYVFSSNGGFWSQDQYIKAPNSLPGMQFGWTVAIDGDRIAVGTPVEGSSARGIDGDPFDNSAPGSGAVYLYSRVQGAWTPEAYVKASNAEQYDQFGSSLALRAGRLVVGAYSEDGGISGVRADEDDNSRTNSGAAYVFDYEDGAWSQTGYLKATNPGASDQMGWAVAVDEGTVVCGAPHEDGPGRGFNPAEQGDDATDAGAVYLY